MHYTLKILLVAVTTIWAWSNLGSAQVVCNGVVSGSITSDVVCATGGACTLDAASITGSVQCASGTLVAKGNSVISGSVFLSGDITMADLETVTILGVVDVKAPNLVDLTITQAATLASVIVADTPGDVTVGGSVTGLSHSASGDLFVNGLTTLATVLVSGGSGIVEVCGSSIGGLSVMQRTGDVEVNTNLPSCAASTLTGGVIVSKGMGKVQVIGATLSSGDFTVTEQIGDVDLQTAQVSDLLLQNNDGSLTVCDVTADSDSTVSGQDGNVVIKDFDTLGDFTVQSVQGDVTLEDSTFDLEDVKLLLVSGDVTVQNNDQLLLAVQEAGGLVQIIGNTIVDGSVSKNTGGVTINNNTFDTLVCADNNPAPTGSGNTIGFGDGQCASGLS